MSRKISFFFTWLDREFNIIPDSLDNFLIELFLCILEAFIFALIIGYLLHDNKEGQYNTDFSTSFKLIFVIATIVEILHLIVTGTSIIL